MTDLTLAELTATIRQINIEKGWRVADGGPGDNTWGDYVALLHSEVSEALEAYRDHRLTDATVTPTADPAVNQKLPPCKPEGVGSELADCVIRLLDMADVFGFKPFDMDHALADVAPSHPGPSARTFGDWNRLLHRVVADLGDAVSPPGRAAFAAHTLRRIAAYAEHCGLDLTAEVNRKIAYNRTRLFRHGGRALADHPAGA